LRDDVAIGGATSLTYTLVAADEDALIKFEVTPVALTGTTTGTAVESAATGAIGGALTLLVDETVAGADVKEFGASGLTLSDGLYTVSLKAVLGSASDTTYKLIFDSDEVGTNYPQRNNVRTGASSVNLGTSSQIDDSFGTFMAATNGLTAGDEVGGTAKIVVQGNTCTAFLMYQVRGYAATLSGRTQWRAATYDNGATVPVQLGAYADQSDGFAAGSNLKVAKISNLDAVFEATVAGAATGEFGASGTFVDGGTYEFYANMVFDTGTAGNAGWLFDSDEVSTNYPQRQDIYSTDDAQNEAIRLQIEDNRPAASAGIGETTTSKASAIMTVTVVDTALHCEFWTMRTSKATTEDSRLLIGNMIYDSGTLPTQVGILGSTTCLGVGSTFKGVRVY
jgi:hypothetical protein